MNNFTPSLCAYEAEQVLITYLRNVGVMDDQGGIVNRERAAQSMEMLSSKLGLLLASAIGPDLAMVVLGRSAQNTARHGKLDGALILRPGVLASITH